MNESLISHWTDAQCREVLEQLLAEEKGRRFYVERLYGGVGYTACVSFGAEQQAKTFTTNDEAQAWLDQQWKEYVEVMKP